MASRYSELPYRPTWALYTGSPSSDQARDSDFGRAGGGGDQAEIPYFGFLVPPSANGDLYSKCSLFHESDFQLNLVTDNFQKVNNTSLDY